jgi:hypothetical protein
MMVLAVRGSDLAVVLQTPASQWLWSIVAIVAVEWLAGSAMVAFALLDHTRQSDPFRGLMQHLSDSLTMPFTASRETPHPEWNGNLSSTPQKTEAEQPVHTHAKGRRL